MKKVLTVLLAVIFVVSVSVIWIWRNIEGSDAALLPLARLIYKPIWRNRVSTPKRLSQSRYMLGSA